MAIVTGRGKRSIEDHFDNAFELESQLKGTIKECYLDDIKSLIEQSTFTYVRQRQMLGLGNAILTGEPLIGNEPFAVILADDLCDCDENGVTSQLIEIYNKYQCSVIAIEELPITQIEQYGVISGDLIDDTNNTYRVNNMIEKPNPDDLIKLVEDRVDLNKVPSYLAIIGRYILTPDIFKILRNIKASNGDEIQITDALMTQAKQGKVVAYKFKGKRFDCGSVDGYLEAIIHFAKKLGINTI